MSKHDSTCAHPSMPCCPGVEFRQIPGHPSYLAGSDGSVWSRLRSGNFGRGITSNGWRRLKPNPAGRYATVNLSDGSGKHHCKSLHVVILLAFKGPCPPGMVAAHNNGKARDCRIENLRWDTQKENVADKRRHGTHLCGNRLSWTKLTAEQVREIRSLIGSVSLREIGRRYGVTRHNIASIRDGKSWAWLK
jgi:hypothetical protein